MLKQTAAEMASSSGPRPGVAGRVAVYHTIARGSHEVPFQTLLDGLRAHGAADLKEAD